MRTLLLIVTTALLTAVWLLYARQSDAFPTFFSLVLPVDTSPITEPVDPNSKLVSLNGNDCITPRNETVKHAEVFLSFQTSQTTVASGGCISKSTVCNDGTRSADQEPYSFSTCVLETPKSCNVSWFIFAHGTAHTFYKPSTAGTCASQERTCSDGEVDGNAAYTYLSCPSDCAQPGAATPTLEVVDDVQPAAQDTQNQDTKKTGTPVVAPTLKIEGIVTSSALNSPVQPNCPSPFGGRSREPGQQGTVYPAITAPFGTTCQQVSIVCMYGSLRYGTPDNPWAPLTSTPSTTCSVADPVDCTSGCGEVKHGELLTTYTQNILPHGNGQTCEDIRIVSTCSDGNLFPAPGDACGCQIAPPASCNTPNGEKVSHGWNLTLYKDDQIEGSLGDGSDICFRQRRQCVNGIRYDQAGAPSEFTYQHTSCTIVPPSSTSSSTTPSTQNDGWTAEEEGQVSSI